MDFNLTDTLAVLERTPGVLRALLAGLPPAWSHADDGPDTWTPFDVVGHLIDGEETDWMTRVRIILSPEEDRRFHPFDRLRHLEGRGRETLDERLQRFTELRERNLQELKSLDLTPELFRRTGEHPAFGTVTLDQLLATWATHDLGHIVQISRTMARQYEDAVGPWKEYLSVLHR